MNGKINVALIYGSTREGRFCDTVASWAGTQIASRGEFAPDVIDPAALTLPARHEREDSVELAALQHRIGQADAFVVVTPEYNHGYPAALKFLIDSFYDEWQAKPVAFVSYGGISANVWAQFDAAGELLKPAHANKSMATMLAQLHWWAIALRDARHAVPYGQAAA
ncbi:MAG: NADPH-dependent FMN reductase [Gammaproteobacteria bacterium]